MLFVPALVSKEEIAASHVMTTEKHVIFSHFLASTVACGDISALFICWNCISVKLSFPC